jgi:hypothetical protein
VPLARAARLGSVTINHFQWRYVFCLSSRDPIRTLARDTRAREFSGGFFKALEDKQLATNDVDK